VVGPALLSTVASPQYGTCLLPPHSASRHSSAIAPIAHLSTIALTSCRRGDQQNKRTQQSSRVQCRYRRHQVGIPQVRPSSQQSQPRQTASVAAARPWFLFLELQVTRLCAYHSRAFLLHSRLAHATWTEPSHGHIPPAHSPGAYPHEHLLCAYSPVQTAPHPFDGVGPSTPGRQWVHPLSVHAPSSCLDAAE
jgi:hypothetical protein